MRGKKEKQSPGKISQRYTTFWVSSITFAEYLFSCITKIFWDHILLSKAPRFAIYSRISALKCTALNISWHSCTNLSWHSYIWVITVVIWTLFKTFFLKNRAAAVLEIWKRLCGRIIKMIIWNHNKPSSWLEVTPISILTVWFSYKCSFLFPNWDDVTAWCWSKLAGLKCWAFLSSLLAILHQR